MHLPTIQQAWEAGFELLSAPIHGGCGVVYKARVRANNQLVALKLTGGPLTDSARLQREVKALRRLDHPHIAALVSSGQIHKQAYLATRWIEGDTLRRRIDDAVCLKPSGMPVQDVMAVSASLADALLYACKAGVAHGDLSPENIMLVDDQTPVLVDFGLGRVAGSATVTALGELAGTPRYLAPEVIEGQSPSPWSDQYGMALVIYEMLTGQWAFGTENVSAASALHHQLYVAPIPVSEVRPDLPPLIDEVFNTALSKSASDRYDDVMAFHAALANACSTSTGSTVAFGKEASSSFTSSHELRRGMRTGLTAAAGALFLGYSWSLNSGDNTVSTSVDTAIVNCNLYVNSAFNQALTDNFYRDAENDSLVTRLIEPAIASSHLIRLGEENRYGVYGVILPVEGGQRYTMSADLVFVDYVHKVELIILWLDSDWQTLEQSEARLLVESRVDGRFSLADAQAPGNARYAVPTLYKDASKGIVYADNVTFSPEHGSCT